MNNTIHTKHTKVTKTATKIAGFSRMPSVSSLVVFVSAVSGALAQAPPGRIVSLVPAVTEMLFAIGAGPQVAA